jgi:hypothetical protein
MAGTEQTPDQVEGMSSSSIGATAAQAGYEYQLNVSVLAALRLLLIAKSATRITLEPANEEDLEADLAPNEPGRVTPQASVTGGYKLVVQALVPYGSLTDALGDDLLVLARKTSDRSLSQVALTKAAELCGPQIRKKIWEIVADKKLDWLRVDAINALSAATTVEADIVKRITADRLLRLSAPLAVSATVLASAHLPVGDVVHILEQVGNSNSHRALLLLGIVVLGPRDRTAAVRLLDLLDVGHPGRRILDSDGVLLPRSTLDDLGDVRIRRYVRPWLQDRIAKE